MKTIFNFQFSIFNSKRGFTLIELLVVIVIIGVLTALIMANFVGIRQRSRDGQRKADMRQIQAALELYRSDSVSYPAEAEVRCGEELKRGSTVYLQKVPCDPLGENQSYKYALAQGGYTLIGCLENDKDGQKDASDACPVENRYSLTYRNP